MPEVALVDKVGDRLDIMKREHSQRKRWSLHRMLHQEVFEQREGPLQRQKLAMPVSCVSFMMEKKAEVLSGVMRFSQQNLRRVTIQSASNTGRA